MRIPGLRLSLLSFPGELNGASKDTFRIQGRFLGCYAADDQYNRRVYRGTLFAFYGDHLYVADEINPCFDIQKNINGRLIVELEL